MDSGGLRSREVKASNKQRLVFPAAVVSVVTLLVLASISAPAVSAAQVLQASGQVSKLSQDCTLPPTVPTLSALTQEVASIQWQNIDSFSVKGVQTTSDSVSITGLSLVGHQVQTYVYFVNGTQTTGPTITTHFSISFDSLFVLRNSTLLSIAVSNLHITTNTTDTSQPDSPTFMSAQLSGAYSVSCK